MRVTNQCVYYRIINQCSEVLCGGKKIIVKK